MTKFREIGSVANAHKGNSDQHCSAIIPENIQNLRERFEESPRKSPHHLSQETGGEKESRYERSYLPTRWSSTPLFRQIFGISTPVFSWWYTHFALHRLSLATLLPWPEPIWLLPLGVPQGKNLWQQSLDPSRFKGQHKKGDQMHTSWHDGRSVWQF